MARGLAIFVFSAMALASCVRVRPHEREDLSRRSMTMDRDLGEERFTHHAEGAREGAEGGTSMPGGGCGCN